MLFTLASRNTLFCLAIGALFSACSGPKGEGSAAGSPTKEPAVNVAAAKVSQINVFVDMSGGMRGFMHANDPGRNETGSEFQRTVMDLLSDVNRLAPKLTAPPSYYFFKEKEPTNPQVLVPSTYAGMTGAVSGGLKNAARGSELPQMLSEALTLQARKPGTVSILISDFIFAPQNVKDTWRIKTFIKDALNAVEPAKLAVSVFANTSEFRGNFYPGNRTGKQPLNGEKLPYYIWVLGDPALVGQVDSGLLRQLAAQPQAHYNVAFAPPYAVPDFLTDPVGNWTVAEGIGATAPVVTFTKKPTLGKPAEIVVALDLSRLPASMVSQVSANTLRLAEAGTGATLTQVFPLAQMPDARQQPALKKYTHFARLRFVQAPAGAPTLRLELARTEPAWVAAYSTASDSGIKKQGPKTYYLKEVMAGVADYFADEPSAQRVFSLPVRVTARD